ncbi:MAG: hypothetical protein Q9160_008743 [Pyrenula sp. 1 TL-2023]
MRTPHGTPEVWVVFDRLWRSKNWVGPHQPTDTWKARDGRTWEHKELGFQGEALGVEGQGNYMEGKPVPMHLRHSHRQFVEDVKCYNCDALILERCEQCSVMMHCVGCRRTLCHSCAFDRPYLQGTQRPIPSDTGEDVQEPPKFWWAPGYTVSPCKMQEPGQPQAPQNPVQNYPLIRFKWCCWEPLFSGGGGISYGGPSPPTRDSDRIRAVPLPKGKGWEDPDFTSSTHDCRSELAHGPLPNLKEAFANSGRPELMEWLIGGTKVSSIPSPRNLCQDCYESEVWKISCKSCSRNLCMEHDLRGLRVRICGYKPLTTEKASINVRITIENRNKEREQSQKAESQRLLATREQIPHTPLRSLSPSTATPSTATDDEGPRTPMSHLHPDTDPPSFIDSLAIVQPTPVRPGPSVGLIDDIPRPLSSGSDRTLQPENDEGSRCTTPSECHDNVGDMQQDKPTSKYEQWTGCLSFFCPSARLVGDHRVLCAPSVKECSSCKVNVCPDCMRADGSRRYEAAIRDLESVEANQDKEWLRSRGCNCSGCESRFYCPNCRRERESKGECKYIQEERKRLADAVAAMLRARKEAHDLHEAELALDRSREFWQCLEPPASSLRASQKSGKKKKAERQSNCQDRTPNGSSFTSKIPLEKSKEHLKRGLKRLVEQNRGLSQQELRTVIESFLGDVSREGASHENSGSRTKLYGSGLPPETGNFKTSDAPLNNAGSRSEKRPNASPGDHDEAFVGGPKMLTHPERLRRTLEGLGAPLTLLQRLMTLNPQTVLLENEDLPAVEEMD